MSIRNIILDNTILIERNFGTRQSIESVQTILDPSDRLFITKITLGEFIRTVLTTGVKIFSEILKDLRNIRQYANIHEFLDTVLMRISTFSLHEKDRIVRIIAQIRQRLIFYFNAYSEEGISLQIALDSIIDDFINFRKIFLDKIIILENSYSCNDSTNIFEYDQLNQSIFLHNKDSCSNCIRESFRYFKNTYSNDLDKIQVSLSNKLKVLGNKFHEAFGLLFNILIKEDFDLRTYPCYHLIDLFVILETPKNSIVFTTNRSHFEPITNILKKSLLFPPKEETP